MSATDLIAVGEKLPRLAAVKPGDRPYEVIVTWSEGGRVDLTDVIDLAPIILTFKVFRPLRDDALLFRTVRLGEWGASLVWDGNPDLDIGADAVEDLAEEAMTSAEFSAFLERCGLSFDAAAAQLGISRRLVAYYASGRIIPRHIALACRYLDQILASPKAA
jgi:hypothetical protein